MTFMFVGGRSKTRNSCYVFEGRTRKKNEWQQMKKIKAITDNKRNLIAMNTLEFSLLQSQLRCLFFLIIFFSRTYYVPHLAFQQYLLRW